MHNTNSSSFDPRNHQTYRILRTALLMGSFCCTFSILTAGCNGGQSEGTKSAKDSIPVKGASRDTVVKETPATPPVPRASLDTALYNRKLRHLANGDSSGRWPVRTAYPVAGAILPFKRIVAYYGNLYSKKMGILGEYPPDEMLRRLNVEVKKW
jgi:hypothetical protein